jgi:hypothetical protein
MQPQSTRLLRICQHCDASFTVYPSRAKRNAARYCSRACSRARHGTPAARFWAKVDTSGGPNACWPWLGARSGDGYGAFYFAGTQCGAHRVAWELTHGSPPIDEDGNPLWVLHNCPEGDNPLCCNPAHLFVGTHEENMADMAKKGRQSRGSRHARVKLTEVMVREIRARYRAGVSQRMLAREYGVALGAIDSVIRRKSWTWLADD